MSHEITATWDPEAEVFRPTARYEQLCREMFVDDVSYHLRVAEFASEQTRKHYFATLDDIYDSLPETMALTFSSREKMRKHALIRTGFFTERRIPLPTHEDALRVAAFLRPQTLHDEYVIVTVDGNIVIEARAMSQTRKAMPEKGQFQRSKVAVLEWCNELIGVKEVI